MTYSLSLKENSKVNIIYFFLMVFYSLPNNLQKNVKAEALGII